VRVPEHTPIAGTADVCAALVASLPDLVDGAQRQEITPAEDGVAAWGSPAILLRCGVPQPEQYEPTSELVEVNGVAWLPVDGVDGQVFFATGRTAWIRVDVPDAYAPEANALLDLAAAVATVPEADG
jgi:hypothetical protein